MPDKKIKSKKGFTFIEVVVSVSIFVIIIAASTEAFSNWIDNYRKVRGLQESLENAQYSMNEMAKILRTSSVINQGPLFVQAYDYSQEVCVHYKLSGGALMLAISAGTIDDCKAKVFVAGEFVQMVSGTVSGGFVAIPSSSTAGSEKVGKITIMLNIKKGTADSVKLQTTVSLRDYQESNIQ
ncbi:MAG: prepilin-type N-terminal cleavage/methylation domain-containing protein [Candidatus Moranbacteria bacterium]|jgi:prepilin-type N-terminal cleavage/methylation domain-containing protein|nr:prepilin-type N-terminal cleavage/methylation domain-containing protein [Candidatus Moranbacteria bacterium]